MCTSTVWSSHPVRGYFVVLGLSHTRVVSRSSNLTMYSSTSPTTNWLHPSIVAVWGLGGLSCLFPLGYPASYFFISLNPNGNFPQKIVLAVKTHWNFQASLSAPRGQLCCFFWQSRPRGGWCCCVVNFRGFGFQGFVNTATTKTTRSPFFWNVELIFAKQVVITTTEKIPPFSQWLWIFSVKITK